MPAGRDEEREMGVGTQAPIGHEPIAWWSARMDRRHPGQLVGQKGGNHPRQEHPGARMAPPQESGAGHAAPRPWLRWRAAGVL